MSTASWALPGIRACLRSGLAAAALLALAACGGGSSEPAAPAPAQGLLRTSGDGDVVAYFQQRLARRAEFVTGAPLLPVAAPGSATTEGSSLGGTVLQEAGVDEDDLLKSDGAMIYALHLGRWQDGTRQPTQLQAARIRADGPLEPVGRMELPGGFHRGMYLAQGRLAILSESEPGFGIADPVAVAADAMLLPWGQRTIALELHATSVGAMPIARHRLELDGTLVSSRRIGDVLYVVSSWAPDLSAFTPTSPTATPTQALTAGALLPTVRLDGGAPEPLVHESDCYLQPDNASPALQLTTITAIDLASAGLQRASRCFVGDASTLYMSPQHVYVASSRQFWIAGATPGTVFPPEMRTDIHKFALRGLDIAYRGSGEVAGHLGWEPEKMPYRMSEHLGDLRVLTFTGRTGWFGPPADTAPATQPSPATLTVLREDAASASLVPVATLPNTQRPQPIGKAGEQVYAVHFAGARAYVVTFRRIDPLYILDLSAPGDPRMVGELEMPGYSDYLYPLANGKLFGVGRDASDTGTVGGLKFALFDVADATAPRVLASHTLGAAGSTSALDRSRHGVHILAVGDSARIALPVLVTEPVGGTVRTSYQGLARFDVDTVQGTLAARPVVVSARFDGTASDLALFARFDVGAERSLQGALGAYYLTGGELLYAAP